MSARLTPPLLAELAAFAEAATPGPWASARDLSGGYAVEARARVTEAGTVSDGGVAALIPRGEAETYANARLIATSREVLPDLLAEVTRLRAELAARPSRAEVLREALAAAEAEHLVGETDTEDDRAYTQGVTDAANAIRALLNGGPRIPLVVSRFDVAMEPAPEEDPVLTIGCIAEDGRPVALLLDPETRRKVHEWTRSGLPPLRAPRDVRVVSTESGTWRVRWYIRQNRKAKSFPSEEQATAWAVELRETARRLHAKRQRGEA
ncbi:hypothetical protein [Streptomyces sp. NPDC088674]|uniref:hypothetical protein n=1 Tax=Streptomyces sp. NPDC088674 TaxID=3365869 RepID=UPI003819D7DC